MDIKKGKEYLTVKDLQLNSLWIESNVDELTYPVRGVEDLPENMTINDLRVRANFKTPSGIELKGYIVGLKNIYCVALFLNDKVIYLNKNLFNDCLIAINKINEFLEKNLKPEQYFPLSYETDIDIEGFKNISGVFDIFKTRTDEERLS